MTKCTKINSKIKAAILTELSTANISVRMLAKSYGISTSYIYKLKRSMEPAVPASGGAFCEVRTIATPPDESTQASEWQMTIKTRNSSVAIKTQGQLPDFNAILKLLEVLC